MLALIEGHPNIDVIIFYVIATAVLTVTLYRHHRKAAIAPPAGSRRLRL